MTGPTTHSEQPLGRFLAGYRGHLSRAEAARRAGVSVDRWAAIETGSAGSPDVGRPSVPAHTVAAMCVAVGADIATGLKLAGHDPHDYEYLLAAPPRLMHLRGPLSPSVAVYRAIVDAAAVPGVDPRPMISSVYREVAAENRRLADRLLQSPPDGRTEYWRGYADALRAIADEQSEMADIEVTPPR